MSILLLGLTLARAALPDPLDFPGRPRFSLDDDRGLRAAHAALRANASWPLRARDGAPAAWPRLRARLARAARGEAPLRVAVLGDSTTFGVGWYGARCITILHVFILTATRASTMCSMRRQSIFIRFFQL